MDNTSQPLSVTIRQMTLDDVSRVRAIDALSFTMPWSERSYRFELTENPNSSDWVAEVIQPDDTREVIGILIIWIIVDEAHVATLAIHPDYRKRGIGQRLLAHGLLMAHERGAVLAYLEVRRSNLGAQSMYHHFGFTIVGERKRYYQDNQEDALLMTLEHLNPEQLRALAQV